MRRNVLNFLVDAVTLLAIFAMIATGLVIRFVLPPGTGGRHGGRKLELWEMGRHEWGNVHFWAAAILGSLLIIHVALHWSWICTMLRRMLGNKDTAQPSTVRHNAYGIGFLFALVAIFGGFIWYADNAVKEVGPLHKAGLLSEDEAEEAPRIGQRESHGAGNESIRGSMTLAEFEEATGVPIATLKTELGLPQETPADERLGRLGRSYGFNMNKVRDIAARYKPQENKGSSNKESEEAGR